MNFMHGPHAFGELEFFSEKMEPNGLVPLSSFSNSYKSFWQLAEEADDHNSKMYTRPMFGPSALDFLKYE